MPNPASPSEGAGLGTLVRINVRRAITIGRIYLGMATALSLLVTGLVVVETSQSGAAGTVIGSVLPSELPIFGVVGSLGALMVFVSDKSKGVYEYLISYGVDTSVISASIVLASLALVSIVLGIAGGASAILVYVRTGAVPLYYLRELFVNAVPLAFAATAFMTLACMSWAAIASPRAGINGPVGFAPTVGIGPLLVVLVTSGLAPPDLRMWIAPGVALALLGVVIGLVALLSRGSVRERFLSTL